MNRFFCSILLLAGLISCDSALQDKTKQGTEIKAPLPSWNEGKVKTEIISFVESVCDENGPSYVPVEERIAVFDNDGTLWAEKPVYFQLLFAIDRLKVMAKKMEITDDSPLAALLNDDFEEFSKSGIKGVMELVMTTHSGMSTEEFDAEVRNWIKNARHPELNKPYTDLVYQPMLELLNYLEANGFKTFIVSGGGIDFMRCWAEEVYGIPGERIIGSSIKTVFAEENGEFRLKRLPELDFINDMEGKPVGIHRHIGKRPIFCAGNSDGDLQMMQWTSAGNQPSLMLYVHHTDSVREYAYDRHSSVGQFDKALDIANENEWTVVSMKDDWQTVYAK